MCKLQEPKADQAQQSSASMRSQRTSLSQQELSAVVVMSFDSYGKIKAEEKQFIPTSYSYDHSETSSMKRTKNKKKCRVMERIKSGRQEQREDVHYAELDSFSETGSCKILKRLKEENKQSKRISSANSVTSSITGSSFGGSIASNLSRSSSVRRRNREALQSKQTQIMSMAELAGFSASTKSKKKKPTEKKQSSGWFKRKVKDSTKRNNKVADWSVTITSVGSTTSNHAQHERTSCSDNPASILRTSHDYIKPLCENSVRFAEGTVFQDPNQVKRKKVPRIRGGRTSYHKKRSSKTTLSVNKDHPESIETALSVDNDMYCNAMAPLVHVMVTSSMGRFFFR
eukprot:CAMPEP_0116136980 /NCGR_PEP_ID=MMETSP0329-20121206/12017_1 /TAXON_ID=697910 /ORGANISM="Pseudo-nitzschia arenysensis, Strain B593" /LENGTH=341 /DNA_ID=CAMNT_0003631891 /DNA_START=312 /DNA_END=1337 /DNA_ORIENTATION=-